MTQSLIRDFKQNWKPDFTGARKHVRLTIKNYSQLDKLVFYKQLDVTAKGLVAVGCEPNYAKSMIAQELKDLGGNVDEWLNSRTASEIISNN